MRLSSSITHPLYPFYLFPPFYSLLSISPSQSEPKPLFVFIQPSQIKFDRGNPSFPLNQFSKVHLIIIMNARMEIHFTGNTRANPTKDVYVCPWGGLFTHGVSKKYGVRNMSLGGSKKQKKGIYV